MAIKLDLGELYGMNNYKEVIQAINELKRLGFDDDYINEVLERSKKGGNNGKENEN